MAEFKDKLIKTKKQKLNPLDVILMTYNDVIFCEWLCKRLSDTKVFSIKRLAKMFLAENPGIYSEYQMNKDLEKENMRIVCDKSFWEND